MSKKVFQESLDAAVKELSEAFGEREELENNLDEVNYRIDKLQEAIRGLSAICNIDYQTEYSNLFPPSTGIAQGFTDKVRSIFSENLETRYSAVDIRNKLREMGFPIDKYSNGLATIHTILRRLHKSGEIQPEDQDGKIYYYMELPF
jgi:hypothetical protein